MRREKQPAVADERGLERMVGLELNHPGHEIKSVKNHNMFTMYIIFYSSTHQASGVCYELTVNHMSDSYLIVKTSMDC
jgi:hypothetical protein